MMQMLALEQVYMRIPRLPRGLRPVGVLTLIALAVLIIEICGGYAINVIFYVFRLLRGG